MKIWYCDEDGIEFNNKQKCYDDFYNDINLNDTSKKLEDLYSSFYHFDRDETCFFYKNVEKENKEYILSLLKIIKERLNQLNNCKFIIQDYCSEYYYKL